MIKKINENFYQIMEQANYIYYVFNEEKQLIKTNQTSFSSLDCLSLFNEHQTIIQVINDNNNQPQTIIASLFSFSDGFLVVMTSLKEDYCDDYYIIENQQITFKSDETMVCYKPSSTPYQLNNNIIITIASKVCHFDCSMFLQLPQLLLNLLQVDTIDSLFTHLLEYTPSAIAATVSNDDIVSSNNFPKQLNTQFLCKNSLYSVSSHLALKQTMTPKEITSFNNKTNTTTFVSIPFTFKYHAYHFIFACNHQSSFLYPEVFNIFPHSTLSEESIAAIAMYQLVYDDNQNITDFKCLEFNKRYNDLFNKNKTDINKTFIELYGPIIGTKLVQVFKQSLNNKNDVVFTFEKGDQKHKFRIRSKAINDDVITIYAEDVAENKQLYNTITAFAHSQSTTETVRDNDVTISIANKAFNPIESLAAVIWGMNAGTWQWNVQTGETIVNHRWAEMLGYTLEEIGPYSYEIWSKMLHPNDLALSEALLEKVFNKEIDDYILDSQATLRNGKSIWINSRGRVLSWTSDGKPLWMFGVHLDISKRKAIEEKNTIMMRQLEIAHLQDKVMLDIASSFISATKDNIDPIINKSLEKLGKIVTADRIYVFMHDYINQTTSNTYEWCSEGIEPFIGFLQNRPIEQIGVWMEDHQQGKTVFYDDVSTLEDGIMKETLSVQGIQSLITVPLIKRGELKGFIGFDSVKQKKSYTEDHRNLLTRYAYELISTLSRIDVYKRLEFSENRFRTIFSTVQSVAVVGFNQKRELLYVNEAAKQLYGYTDNDISTTVTETFFPEDIKHIIIKKFQQLCEFGGSYKAIESTHYHRDGTKIDVLTSRVVNDTPFGKEVYSIDIDLREIRDLQKKLQYERELFHKTLLSIGDGVISTDINGNIQLMNTVTEQLTGYSQQEAIGQPINSILHVVDEKTRKPIQQQITEQHSTPLILLSKDGNEYIIENNVAPIKDGKGNLKGSVIVFRDSTEKMIKQRENEYLSTYDFLTGLYNRRALERISIENNTTDKLPLTFMYIDVNGLKLTNDAFGHDMGDKLLQKVATIIQSSIGENDVAGRIGGDEFMILSTNSSQEYAKKLKSTIINQCKTNDDHFIISLAIGYMTKTTMEEEIETIRTIAENQMYKDKLMSSKNMRIKTIETVLRNINLKYDNEQVHSERVSLFSELIAREMKLSYEEINDIKTAALLHDIGKIAVPSEVLRKQARLNFDEYEAMKKHSEIGYQILKSVDEYHRFATIVLHHHERWDGNGYPYGLKGTEIPLASRIICVADAFEAMTANRCYQARREYTVAIEELIKCSWTQFDGDIVNIFVRGLRNEPYHIEDIQLTTK